MPYQISYVDPNGQTGLAYDGRIYETGEEANAARVDATRFYPEWTYSIKPYAGPNALPWREREARRMDNQYMKTPWDHLRPLANRPDLFEHMSEKSPGMVSYTESDAKGAADKQAPAMAPGRFLTKFYSHALSANDIEAYTAAVSEMCGHIELNITQDADEIEAVYRGGPTSCMSHGVEHYNSHIHPTRAYAGPDLAVAYLGPLNDATARCVVWPARKLHSRIYGDTSRMTRALANAGYTRAAPEGARIQRIVHRGGRCPVFVVPYSDDFSYAYDDGEYLVLGAPTNLSDEEVDIRCQYGTSDGDDPEPDEDTYCACCGDYANSAYNIYYIDCESQQVCGTCLTQFYSLCEYDNEYYPCDRILEVHGHASYNSVADDNLRFCDVAYVPSRDEYWHMDYVALCPVCGECFHIDDLSRHKLADEIEALRNDDEGVCTSCMEYQERKARHDEHVEAYRKALRDVVIDPCDLPTQHPELAAYSEPLCLAA